jgi:cyclic pyranopterin phosphate synthase
MADVRMIDVGPKDVTRRRAVARARVRTTDEVLGRLEAGTVPKGDVLGTARVAGIMAAKNTPDILPLCHPLLLTHVRVDLAIDRAAGCVRVETACETEHRTGVEMEALCAAAAAALCVHDMCKGLDPAIVVDDLCVVSKSGGKTGNWQRPEDES